MSRTKKADNKVTEQQPTQSEEPKRRGRAKGMKLEKNEVIIEVIPNLYRIDYSDGRNFTVQKYTTKTRMTDDEEGKWKIGDKYQEWSDADNPYHSCIENALIRIKKLMEIDKAKEKGTVTIDDFLKISKESDEKIFNLFKSKLDK